MSTDGIRRDGPTPRGSVDGGCGPQCAEALERLEAYLDGELPGADIAEISEHLTACYPCTERATFEEQLRSIVRRECVEHAPTTLVDRVRVYLADLPSVPDLPAR